MYLSRSKCLAYICRYFTTSPCGINGGKCFGAGKSEKHVISLLVLITVDSYTEPLPEYEPSSWENFHNPPMLEHFSKQTGSSPSSKQHLMETKPLTPAPIMATFIVNRHLSFVFGRIITEDYFEGVLPRKVHLSVCLFLVEMKLTALLKNVLL